MVRTWYDYGIVCAPWSTPHNILCAFRQIQGGFRLNRRKIPKNPGKSRNPEIPEKFRKISRNSGFANFTKFVSQQKNGHFWGHAVRELNLLKTCFVKNAWDKICTKFAQIWTPNFPGKNREFCAISSLFWGRKNTEKVRENGQIGHTFFSTFFDKSEFKELIL